MKSSLLSSTRLARLDAVGATLLTLCAVHCLAMPCALAFLPTLGLTFLADETWEKGVCAGMMLLASGCLWQGCRQYRRLRVWLGLAVGMPLLLYAQFGLNEHSGGAGPTEVLEAGFMFVGGLCIAISHLHNRRLAHQCRKGCCGRE